MRSIVRRIGFASLAVGALALSPSARAQDKTPSDADRAEFQSINDTDLRPLGQNAQAAIDMAAKNPAGACQMAKSTLPLAADAKQRFDALYDHMTGEGIDLSSLAATKANLESAPDKMNQLATSICSGEFVKMQNDPAMKDMAPIGAYMKAYTDDIIAADAARGKGDTATACLRDGDGHKQLDALSGYVDGLRNRGALSAEETKALDDLDDRIDGFLTQTEARLTACPATK